MKAIYSHWNTEIGSNGYNNFHDFATMMALSVLNSRKHFQEVNLVTNSLYAKILIDELELPFDNVSTSHDRFDDLPKWQWGYAKLAASAEQTSPFVHIDNDVVLWKGIESSVKSRVAFFQSLEAPFKGFYNYYNPLLKFAETLPNLPKVIKDNSVPWAYNCGITGINDLSIIQDWFKLSTSFIRDKDNIQLIEANKDLLPHQNLLHEQYFIASLCQSRKLKVNRDIGFILDYNNLHEDAIPKGYTHLWGGAKNSKEVMIRVKEKLLKESPQYGKFIIDKLNNLF